MKTYGGGGIALPFLTSALDGAEWPYLRPGRILPGERTPDTHRVGGWVDPGVNLDAVEKKKIPVPDGNQTPAVHLITRCYTD
jgi:hypothetical protein